MGIRYELNVTRQWLKRRWDRGEIINADELWRRIQSSWPGLSKEEHEKIFQECEKERKRRT